MQILELPPEQPNFLLVVFLAAVAGAIILVLGYLFVSFEADHLNFHPRPQHLTSQLILPTHTNRSKLT